MCATNLGSFSSPFRPLTMVNNPGLIPFSAAWLVPSSLAGS